MTRTLALSSGDVIGLATFAGDFTGSLVDADKPGQVISGHFCANVPDGVGYCDHLEEPMFPVDTLGTNYIINPPAVTSLPNGKDENIRVIATSHNPTLTHAPPHAWPTTP